MNALQVVKPRQFKQVQAVVPDLETTGADHILVQPGWVSMCGSDIPFFTGRKRYVTYPLQVGAHAHECVGRVVESTSKQFLPGDQVIAKPEEDLGLAQYFIAKAENAAKLPNNLDDNGASCLIQPLSTVMFAVDRLGKLDGKSIAVVGLGSIGLLFCWSLKKRGATRILGIDPIKQRCQTATQMGADEVIPTRSIEVWHEVRENLGSWEAPEICIETVGHQMDTINDCLALVKQQGTVLAFGVPDHLVYAIEYETFFRKNANLMACVTPNWSEYLLKSRDLFLAEGNELVGLVTHRFPVRQAGKAFSLYEEHGDGILKAVLDMSDW